MGKEYKQLKEITLQDVLDLEDTFFRNECLARLIDCGFIEKGVEKWEKITLKDLDRIRPGVTLKRMFAPHETIIHVASDPYWTSWPLTGRFDHILVYKEKLASSGKEEEVRINHLFEGEIYIQV